MRKKERRERELAMERGECVFGEEEWQGSFIGTKECVTHGTIHVPGHMKECKECVAVNPRHAVGVLVGRKQETVTTKPILCRLGFHAYPRYVIAYTQSPTPIRCDRCRKEYRG